MNQLSADLQQFLAQHTEFALLDTGKVKCTLTGHECKPEVKLFEEHMKGRKYIQAAKAKAMQENPIDFSKYEGILEYVGIFQVHMKFHFYQMNCT